MNSHFHSFKMDMRTVGERKNKEKIREVELIAVSDISNERNPVCRVTEVGTRAEEAFILTTSL